MSSHPNVVDPDARLSALRMVAHAHSGGADEAAERARAGVWQDNDPRWPIPRGLDIHEDERAYQRERLAALRARMRGDAVAKMSPAKTFNELLTRNDLPPTRERDGLFYWLDLQDGDDVPRAHYLVAPGVVAFREVPSSKFSQYRERHAEAVTAGLDVEGLSADAWLLTKLRPIVEAERAKYAKQRAEEDERKADESKRIHAARLADDPIYALQCQVRELTTRIATLEAASAAKTSKG